MWPWLLGLEDVVVAWVWLLLLLLPFEFTIGSPLVVVEVVANENFNILGEKQILWWTWKREYSRVSAEYGSARNAIKYGKVPEVCDFRETPTRVHVPHSYELWVLVVGYSTRCSTNIHKVQKFLVTSHHYTYSSICAYLAKIMSSWRNIRRFVENDIYRLTIFARYFRVFFWFSILCVHCEKNFCCQL